jgi:hypothetical protein
MTVDGTPADGEPSGAFDEAFAPTSADKPSSGPRTLTQLAAQVAAIHRFHGVTFTFKPGLGRQKPRRVRIARPTGDPTLRISGHASKQLQVR